MIKLSWKFDFDQATAVCDERCGCPGCNNQKQKASLENATAKTVCIGLYEL